MKCRYYMEMLINTCKRRSVPATTGMVPFVLSQLPPGLSEADAIQKAKDAKRSEAMAGSDGALVYDLALVKPIQQVCFTASSSFKKVSFYDHLFSLCRSSLRCLRRRKVRASALAMVTALATRRCSGQRCCPFLPDSCQHALLPPIFA